MEGINAELFCLLQSTLESDKNVRAEAESKLEALSHQLPDFIVYLLRFATFPVDETLLPRSNSTFLAAAVRFRNIVGRSDWNRNQNLSDDVKEVIRSLLVPLQCQPHVEEHIRRQLLAVTSDLLQYDYPSRWPQVVPQVTEILHSVSTELALVDLTAMRNEGSDQISSSMSDVVRQLLLRLKGGLGVLRYCCKVYETSMDKIPAELGEAFSCEMIPSLIQLFHFLVERWEHEAQRHLNLFSFEGSQPTKYGTKKCLEVSDLFSELSHCLRLIVKCLFSLCAHRWPKELCKKEVFCQFFHLCLRKPTEVLQTLFPLFQRKVEEDAMLTNWYGDRFNEFQEAAAWRLMKWIGTFMHKLIEDFSDSKHCEKRCRNVAKSFLEEGFLLYIPSYSRELVRWHSGVILLNSKAYIMALECLTLLVSNQQCYTEMLLPAAEDLLVHLLFPRLAFTSDDVELWNLNPEEYVRKQSNPIGALFDSKAVCSSLMISLVIPKKPFHDTALLQKLLEFVFAQFEMHSECASKTILSDPARAEMESARRIDASLYCLYALAKDVKHSEWSLVGDSLESVLVRYVVAATAYPIGFIRARAVQVLSVFASLVSWSSPQQFHRVIQSVLPLLQDAEAPVKVQTCTSFSLLLHHHYAFEVINPCITEVVAQYFHVMRMIDNEAVVRTLKKTIRYYSGSLCQWAVELTEMICQHFLKVMETASGKFLNWSSDLSDTAAGALDENDNFVDVLMTADELLATLEVLIKSIPAASEASSSLISPLPKGEGEFTVSASFVSTLMCQIQERVAPLLHLILSYRGGSAYGFMDPSLRLLTTLVSRSTVLVPSMWAIIPCLHGLVLSGAVDYFGQMLAPLDNYSSVEPLHFAVTPFEALCPPPADGKSYFDDLKMMQWTPAQIVMDMGNFVFLSPALRLREKASVPKIYDAFLQNYWWASAVLTSGPTRGENSSVAGDISNSAFALTAQSSYAMRMLSSAITTSTLSSLASSASSSFISSPTMKVLLANAVFSSLLADWIGTCRSMEQMSMLPGFFEAYTSLVSTSGLIKLLRGYDRRLVIAAVTEGIRNVQQCREGGDSVNEWYTLATALDDALKKMVSSQMILCFAQLDEEDINQETVALLKYQERRAQQSRKKNANDDTEEDSEWEDDEEDDDEMWGEDFDDLEEDSEGEEDALHGADDAGELSQLAQKARQARESAQEEEVGVGSSSSSPEGVRETGEDELNPYNSTDDQDDNLLDEEDMEAPILMKVNVWMALLDGASVAQHVSSAAATFFSPDLHDQKTAISRAADALKRWNEVQNVGDRK